MSQVKDSISSVVNSGDKPRSERKEIFNQSFDEI